LLLLCSASNRMLGPAFKAFRENSWSGISVKFKAGDEIDAAHCTALKHEFLRCEDAFKDFERSAHVMIIEAQNEEQSGAVPTINQNRFISYKTYNSYARFIHHLYEFMIGALAREIGDTGQISHDLAERYIIPRLSDQNPCPYRHQSAVWLCMGAASTAQVLVREPWYQWSCTTHSDWKTPSYSERHCPGMGKCHNRVC